MSDPVTSATAAAGTLAGSGGATNAQIKAAAQQFEAILVRQMLGEARKTDFGNTLLSNEGMNTFRDMQDSNVADTIAKRGTLGFAKMIAAQLARQTHTAGGTD